jgi:orotate phosphoribosyltransferase
MGSLASPLVATRLERVRELPEFERLKALLKKRSYREGDFVLSSGKRSNFYLDARTTTLCAEGSVCVGRLIWALIEPLAVDAVGGLTLGADPVVSAVVMASQLSGANKPVDGFLIRKEAKGHGAKRQVEGFGDNALPKSIILVEDVTTTGLSFDTAMAAIQKDLPDATVVLGVSIVDRRESLDNPNTVGVCGLPFQALMRIEELQGDAC